MLTDEVEEGGISSRCGRDRPNAHSEARGNIPRDSRRLVVFVANPRRRTQYPRTMFRRLEGPGGLAEGPYPNRVGQPHAALGIGKLTGGHFYVVTSTGYPDYLSYLPTFHCRTLPTLPTCK